MAWRNPRFSYLHAARDANAAGGNIFAYGIANTYTPVQNLSDARMSSLFKFDDSSANHFVAMDLGASYATGFDRLYIPKGHNLNGGYVAVVEDTIINFGSPTTLKSATAITSTDAIDLTLTASSERYLSVGFPTTSGAWEIGEIWITQTNASTWSGLQPPDPKWIDEMIPGVEQFHKQDSIQSSPDLRHFEFTYSDMSASTVVAIEAFVKAVSTYKPFLLDPPWDDEDAVVCKLDASPIATVHRPYSNALAHTKSITLSMTEVIA